MFSNPNISRQCVISTYMYILVNVHTCIYTCTCTAWRCVTVNGLLLFVIWPVPIITDVCSDWIPRTDLTRKPTSNFNERCLTSLTNSTRTQRNKNTHQRLLERRIGEVYGGEKYIIIDPMNMKCFLKNKAFFNPLSSKTSGFFWVIQTTQFSQNEDLTLKTAVLEDLKLQHLRT